RGVPGTFRSEPESGVVVVVVGLAGVGVVGGGGMSRVAYTKRERARITHHALGHRPVNNWGDGDLPAPWAAGDIVEYLGGGKDGRLDGFDPGFYVVCTAFSISVGDAWYFRVSDREKCSDRLHVYYPDR